MSKLIDLTEQRFGRLVVIKWVKKDKWRQSYWLCQCDCGKEKIVCGNDMKRGKTKSCGCLNIEKIIERFTTHGRRYDKIYQIWSTMIQRCTNPNHIQWEDYGGRGITVCQRWMEFENFLEDMGECSNGHSIDRIDNDGNYEKSNCRWATGSQQCRNKRNNHLVTHNGYTKCITQWAEELGINIKTLAFRLNSDNWSTEDALTIPVGQKRASIGH